MLKRTWRIALLTVLVAALAGCGASSGGIESGISGAGGAEAKGQVTRPDKAAGTFTLQPLVEWSGFVPKGDSVDVVTNGSTRFYDRSGAEVSADSWYDYVTLNLAPSTAARAKGTHSNGVIHASEVRLE